MDVRNQVKRREEVNGGKLKPLKRKHQELNVLIYLNYFSLSINVSPCTDLKPKGSIICISEHVVEPVEPVSPDLFDLNSSNCSTSIIVDADNEAKKEDKKEESCVEKESTILSSSGKSMIATSSTHFAVVFGVAVYEN